MISSTKQAVIDRYLELLRMTAAVASLKKPKVNKLFGPGPRKRVLHPRPGAKRYQGEKS